MIETQFPTADVRIGMENENAGGLTGPSINGDVLVEK